MVKLSLLFLHRNDQNSPKDTKSFEQYCNIMYNYVWAVTSTFARRIPPGILRTLLQQSVVNQKLTQSGELRNQYSFQSFASSRNIFWNWILKLFWMLSHHTHQFQSIQSSKKKCELCGYYYHCIYNFHNSSYDLLFWEAIMTGGICI